MTRPRRIRAAGMLAAIIGIATGLSILGGETVNV
jgi:hypothetical protein